MLTADADRCFNGTAPSLGLVNAAYGNGTSEEWLVYQLTDLSEFSGSRDKLTPRQIGQLAELIAADYYYLSVAELMLFCRRFKMGRYGRFYGSVDPIIITGSLRQFVRERAEAIDAYEHEQERLRREEEMKCAVTWEEYIATHEVDDTTNPFYRDYSQEQPKEQPKEDVLALAKSLLAEKEAENGAYGAYVALFVKKYGCTPSEYVKARETGNIQTS